MIYQGDVRDVLPTLDAGSVQCVVTSPPYWNLRNYGVDGQIGLEPTPDAYVETLVDVFREVRRVLRDDGTVWLNLGDSYASQGGPEPAQTKWQIDGASNTQNAGRSRTPGSLKPKDLCMIPARVALALQADGWYLRSDIIWAKGLSFCPSYAGSVMPESCTDRPTSAYEHMFLLTKQARYYYDVEAVREAHASGEWWDRPQFNIKGNADRGDKGQPPHSANPAGRNLRNVWAINPQPFREAHFATFPMALVEPCIKAGTSQKGQCSACGSPLVRVVERSPMEIKRSARNDHTGNRTGASGTMTNPPESKTTGWKRSCECDAGTTPQIVMDPFAGSGTTGIVAARHGRAFVGIELNPQYAQMAGESIDGPLFTEP